MTFLPALCGQYHAAADARARLYVDRAHQQRHKTTGRRRITFQFSRELVEQLGWQGGERLVLSIGIGDDLGSFLFSRTTKPRTGLKLCPNSNAHGFRIAVSLPPEIHGVRPADLIDALQAPTNLDFTVVDGVLRLAAPPAEERSGNETTKLALVSHGR